MKNKGGMIKGRIPAAVRCALLLSLAATVPAHAATVPVCTPQTCDWSITLNGVMVDKGSFGQSSTGVLQATPVNWSGSGTSVSLNLNGSTDPTLGFNFSAGTTTAADSFAISFSLPIALAGQISANSQTSYSLTSTTSAGATLNPTFAQLVTALDASSTAAVPSQSFGVNTGAPFSVSGGPATQISQVFSAANLYSLAAGNGYDLMTVTLAFTLSANSNVGISGFVSQTPVPLPAAVWLFLSALALLGGYRRMLDPAAVGQ